ncbi:SDR family NAD(P)-dependent oxidoreductase [Methylobacterium mesophilicum]|uniref:SDR family NAD(P)-dependent oxidoreductase n=1 Tax=Methylobacterium mesophilicum TaxID=39956 RepID=UPI001FCF1451|nr:SDR family NAD(P)-dependent oxidoreductase [Methylobacterium mesophilicum]
MVANIGFRVGAAALLASVCGMTEAHAGAFGIREQSTQAQGLSYAGAASGSGGVSSIFWNPATITMPRATARAHALTLSGQIAPVVCLRLGRRYGGRTLFDRVFRVNVKSIFHYVRAIAPLMRDAGGGVILNVSSTAALRPQPGLTWYNASKGAASLASKSLALELAPWKIRVNALCPVMGATGVRFVERVASRRRTRSRSTRRPPSPAEGGGGTASPAAPSPIPRTRKPRCCSPSTS